MDLHWRLHCLQCEVWNRGWDRIAVGDSLIKTFGCVISHYGLVNLCFNRIKFAKNCLVWCFELMSLWFLPFQFLNVYCTKYDTGGQYWPIAHNTTIFSLILTQIICLGVFGLKESPVAAGFTVPLIIFTLLFNQYCRKRHLPLFKTFPAQVGAISLNL